MPGQQRSPLPPQGAQLPAPVQTLNAAVQPTPPAQQVSPISPHAPALQPPPLHVPCPAEHVPPSATHCPVLPSQQPPLHVEPSQHGCPAPPHALQVAPLHTRPEATQKSVALLLPVGSPGQHAWPLPPHMPPCGLQLPLVHWPSGVEPQLIVDGMQVPATQHAPVELQASPAQQGPLSAPHATEVPALQTVPLPVASPEATQLLLTQQPPPPQVLPGQHG